MPLLERMRDGRKSPQVLNLKLLSIRSSRPNSLVFFFESREDVSVYGDWISRVPGSPRYEPVPGNGKEQLLAFQLMLEQDGRLRGVYFFVDHDYDDNPPLEHVFVLRAYSIENLLCLEDAVESLLLDELRCTGDPAARDTILEVYRNLVSRFEELSFPLHEALYIARKEGFRIVARPDSATDYLNISLQGVTPKFTELDQILTVNIELSPEKLAIRKSEFSALESPYAIRGKYALQVLREWLRHLVIDRRSDSPQLFPRMSERLPGSPDQVGLRRLASATRVPEGLTDFLQAIAA
ncbi:DUF4435 domain-containing protein [Stenotrophomonas maltophilia]|uniref:DUF4435 domain-containing protein n=1 Tax=Stenotrophomonas maltophilia TaxID=40324 RepID=UPI000DA92064|nr:DUF4435 domain-containing protein [Stenotrophomonas maltophilia]